MDVVGGRSARLVLMCGLPGAGKTTLARRLATELPAVRLCPDEWMARLGVDLYDGATRERLESVFWEHAKQLLALGANVVLESGFWLRSDRDEKRLGARAIGAAVELRYLAVPVEELWRRVDARNHEATWTAAPITREMLDLYVTCFEPPDAGELALFDAAAMLPDT